MSTEYSDDLVAHVARAKKQAEAEAWTGYDFDGTVAFWGGWDPKLGEPIPGMLARMKQDLAEGKKIKILTARVWRDGQSQAQYDEQIQLLQQWCERHLGVIVPITNEKDYYMETFYDDRCVQVLANTGVPIMEVPGVAECVERFLRDLQKETIRRVVKGPVQCGCAPTGTCDSVACAQ